MTAIIVEPNAIRLYQAATIRAALLLHAHGLKHSRLSGRQVLSAASAFTGKPYKRGQYEVARRDLAEWLATYRTLPDTGEIR